MEAGVISALVDIGEDPREKVFDLVTHAKTEHQTAFLKELMKKCTTKQLWGVGLKVGIIRSDPKATDWISDLEEIILRSCLLETTCLLPELADLVMSYMNGGYLKVGSFVDARDQIGKWVFGRIEKIEGKSTQREHAHVPSTNCPVCQHFVSKTDGLADCPVCGTKLPPIPELPPANSANGEDSVRCFVTFYGWDVFFNEWVGLDRICKGGSLIKETWLYAGNIVVLRQTSASASDDACKEPDYDAELPSFSEEATKTSPFSMIAPTIRETQVVKLKMARVLHVKSSKHYVLFAHLQVDPLLPFSFKKPEGSIDATPQELRGVWVPLTAGLILQNGSFKV